MTTINIPKVSNYSYEYITLFLLCGRCVVHENYGAIKNTNDEKNIRMVEPNNTVTSRRIKNE